MKKRVILMNSETEKFLMQRIRSFYASAKIKAVPSIEAREFGIGSLGKKIVKRHLSFSSEKELNEFLRMEAPPFISYSNAYYQKPSARPMEAKGFMGADLVYEFDADDIPTPCKKEHDSWKCQSCGAEGKGSLQNCPECGAVVKVKQWFCSECLEAAKRETLKLLSILEKEFGFTGLSINFSGNAGYHVHVRSKEVHALPQRARIELLDYLTFNGFSLEEHGFGVPLSMGDSRNSAVLTCPIPSKSKGLTARFMKRLVSFIKEWDTEKLAVYGMISKRESLFLQKNKEKILEKMEEGILLPINASRPKTSQKFWKSLIEKALIEETIKLNVDRQTSVDMHRILRMPGTIHGSTGLIASVVERNELKKFNPFSQSVVFSSEPVKVFINNSPEFELKGEKFGPFNEQQAELPEYAAFYLLAKGRASLGGNGNGL